MSKTEDAIRLLSHIEKYGSDEGVDCQDYQDLHRALTYLSDIELIEFQEATAFYVRRTS